MMRTPRVSPRTIGAFALVALGVCLIGFPRKSGLSPVVVTSAADQGDLWLAPSSGHAPVSSPLSRALADLLDGNTERALPALTRATSDPVLGNYARLYLGRAQLSLNRSAEAAETARVLIAAAPGGYLGEAALWLAADAAEQAENWPSAISALRAVIAAQPQTPARARMRLARAASNAGDRAAAVEALTRTYYDFPLTAEASEATTELARLGASIVPSAASLTADLARAQALYGARRYTDARKAFEPLRTLAAGDDRSLIDLRLAQCDFYLKRHAIARDALRAYMDRSSTRLIEAQYFYLGTLRELGRHDEYIAQVRAFVEANPTDTLAETALNDLGTHYILENEDGKAADVFVEMYQRYPSGAFGDRAAWKGGWWAYKNGDFGRAIEMFETAAVRYRRADYRPSWLYWAARAHEQRGERDLALAGFRQVVADYRNSYYGRQATREIDALIKPSRPAGAGAAVPARSELPATIVGGVAPANAPIIGSLLNAGLYDDAIAELRQAQRLTGTSPLIEATIAFALNRKGDLRPGITAMRRAYPQFMAEGGEALPVDLLRVIFPVDHWELIHKHATSRKVDPYLATALIAQESTFQADVRSVANAWGLMQVLPATGRRYATRLGIKPFSTARLTEPETNIRIGMAYFADLLEQFGDPAPALAAYNAGENRVSRWLAERPGVARDEFIDDIPFPETQNYVKRVLGTAEDYRVLYRDLKPSGAARTGG